MTPMMSAPTITLITVPLPPKKLAPPMMTAAMAASLELARRREARIGPARREHPGEPCHETADDEHRDKHPVHGYTLPARRLLVTPTA